jgi:RimJ/RimL family protein N-acetyltransferase
MIETLRIKLIPWDDVIFEVLFRNDMTLLAALLDIHEPDDWTTFADAKEALPIFYKTYKKQGFEWGSFFAIHKIDRVLLGTCGYKGKPNAEGVVEIGYEIIEPYRLQGLATEVAKGLVNFAFQEPTVQKVLAHTLAHENPSVSVLKKLGFQFAQELNDPDDGPIWQFELKRVA